MRIGERIKALRETAGMRQIDLAKKLDVALTTISGWENTDRTPRIEVIEKIAEVFGVTPSIILGTDEKLDQLEEDFSEGVRMLRRANRELTKADREELVKYMEFMINTKKKG